MQFAPVFGYIDPMSGAIVLQLILAALAGTAAFFRRAIWRCVRAVFGGRRESQEVTEAAEN